MRMPSYKKPEISSQRKTTILIKIREDIVGAQDTNLLLARKKQELQSEIEVTKFGCGQNKELT